MKKGYEEQQEAKVTPRFTRVGGHSVERGKLEGLVLGGAGRYLVGSVQIIFLDLSNKIVPNLF